MALEDDSGLFLAFMAAGSDSSSLGRAVGRGKPETLRLPETLLAVAAPDIYIHMCIYTYTRHTYVCIYPNMYAYIYLYRFVYIYVYIYSYIYIDIHTYTHTCMHACIHIPISVHLQNLHINIHILHLYLCMVRATRALVW